MSFPIIICSTYSKITALLQCDLEGKEQWWTWKCSWPSGNNFIVSLHMVGVGVMTQDGSMNETEYYFFWIVYSTDAVVANGHTPDRTYSRETF